jgi:hypothetical protein
MTSGDWHRAHVHDAAHPNAVCQYELKDAKRRKRHCALMHEQGETAGSDAEASAATDSEDEDDRTTCRSAGIVPRTVVLFPLHSVGA